MHMYMLDTYSNMHMPLDLGNMRKPPTELPCGPFYCPCIAPTVKGYDNICSAVFPIIATITAASQGGRYA